MESKDIIEMPIYVTDEHGNKRQVDSLVFVRERTCERILYKPTGVLVCSECGAGMPKQLDKYCYLHYCPNCGCKVVDE